MKDSVTEQKSFNEKGIDCVADIAVAVANEFLLINRNKPNNFIWGELLGGELSFIVENRPKDGKGCKGMWLFAKMMEHIGDDAEVVRGSWTYGVNLARVNKLTGAGITIENAVSETWTAS